MAHFTPALFEFLSELADNNQRGWFDANRDRYRHAVQEPMLRFIADVAEPLRGISRHFVADPRPSGGSMFRIYRDTRFSRDKRPYKTHAAAQFRHHAGRDVHAPGFYVHIEPGNVFAGAGLWHPPAPTLTAVRGAVVEHPERWKAVTADPSFSSMLSLGGDSLKRAPRGVDPGHPLVDDLKRKDFVCSRRLEDRDVLADGFLDRFIDTCRAAAPLVRFLTEAVGLEFDEPPGGEAARRPAGGRRTG